MNKTQTKLLIADFSALKTLRFRLPVKFFDRFLSPPPVPPVAFRSAIERGTAVQRMTDEIHDFLAARDRRRGDAAQMVALLCACGLDLAALLSGDAGSRATALRQIERQIARERLKGLNGHWSYDLNRHIALKQAAERLRRADGVLPRTATATAQNKDGANRRRRVCK